MIVEIPEYLTKMVGRRVPVAEVVRGTTPVLSFGDPRHAKVATLGINPSVREFVEDGRMLSGPLRRLATLESLGAQSTSRLTEEQIRAVIKECASYFHPNRNPYRLWFDPLDQILRAGLGVSYYDGSACHLDLVQWATDPVWGNLSDGGVKQALLKEGLPHLRNQLKFGKIRLVVLNGREVLDQVAAVGLARLESSGTLRVGALSCSLYSGKGEGVRFIGWSTNLQSSFGVTLEFRSQLGRWLAATKIPKGSIAMVSAASTKGQQPAVQSDDRFDAGYVVEGRFKLPGKADLLQLLNDWLEVSPRRSTIGVVGKFGGRPCIFIALHKDRTAVLNVDTKRTAVEQYVEDARERGPDVPWSVIPNQRGRVNKLVFREDKTETQGWYCYLLEPLSAPAKI
jgi:hypothetical protein